MKTVYIVSLGCDKNRVDTEQMLYLLSNGGYGVSDRVEDCSAIIVNTCAFVESARVEAIETILELAGQKGESKKLIVTGCLPQKYRAEIEKDLPEVDAFLGVRDYEQLVEILDSLTKNQRENKDVPQGTPNDGKLQRIRTTPPHYAYLRISDGCNNKCTFCTIPSIRGPYKSVSSESLIAEAKGLAKGGVRELIFIAQDVTRYGVDLFGTDEGTKPLCDLIDKISQIDGIDYIRLMYCYPDVIDDRLIDTIAGNPKVVKYLDIPMQHISDKILKGMGRRGSKKDLRQLVETLYKKIPDITLRSTLMVGFPGETEKEFQELTDFIKWAKIRHLGFFAYSREEDTPSYKLKEQVSQSAKDERFNAIATIQADIAANLNKQFVGKTVRAIYEDIDYDRNMFVARPLFSAPEIDSVIYFKTKFADVGSDVDIKITGVDGYDLIGEVK
ncbi:MAG: 30S ribosomal protein S12 methylthiotransferase RimO [Firmicutes bacterium]|nr:30S ribosomal protein S12 methylthiotransferase RimO [Bacillota bacterium]